MQRQDRSRRKHRPLHTLLPALGDEGANVGELTEHGLVDAGLPSRRQWRPGLCDDQADFAGRDLHPGMLLDAIDRPDANGDPGHQQVRLVPGFAMKRDRTALRAPGSPAADHQSHFVGTDAMNRQERDDEQEQDERHCEHDHSRRLNERASKHGGPPSADGVS